jgi:ribosome biogenesis GTPase
MHKGRVISSTGAHYIVELLDGEQVRSLIAGKFRQKGIRSTNPVAVGDWVMIEKTSGDGIIKEIEKRKNYIARKSVNLSKQSHILASNLDQAILVATIKQPITFPTFIDRYCVAAEAFHIPVVLVFNKADLLDDEEREILESFVDVYRQIGYKTLITSVETGEGIEEMKNTLMGKVSLVSGHSGVGKSSLINEINPGFDLRVGSISEFHGTGKHTTTNAEMHQIAENTYIVDTPGIRGFGIVDIDKEELAGYFPEMRAKLPECKYYNCLHLKEPGCAVKEAVEEGFIAETRYKSYVNMYEENEGSSFRQ